MHKSSHLSVVSSHIRWTVYSKSTVEAVKTYTAECHQHRKDKKRLNDAS